MEAGEPQGGPGGGAPSGAVAAPDPARPDATRPDATRPDTTGPDATRPDTTGSGTTRSGTTRPGSGSPSAGGDSAPPARGRQSSPPVRLLLGSVVASLGALAAGVQIGGGLVHSTDLADAGTPTDAAQPVATLVMNGAGTVTVGLLLMAAVFLPPRSGELPARAYACLRAASLSAVVWALSALATAELTFSVLIGLPAAKTLDPDLWIGFLTDVSQGRALLTVALLATLIAVGAHLPRTVGGAGGLLAVALTALIPPVLTGHTITSPDHAFAVYAVSVHVIAAALWVGGLVALVASAARAADLLPVIVPRYSTMALGCYTAIAVSGTAAAWLHLEGRAAALFSAYGALLAGKTLLLCGLGVLGWRQRRAGLPSLNGPARGRAFARLAAAEVVLMAVVMGLAVALARSHPPQSGTGFNTRAALLLGYDLPGPADAAAYALDWRLDPLWLTLLAAGAALYAAGVVRLRRRGHQWPVARIAAWYAGLLVLFAATCGGVARYSMVLFSAHVAQHVILGVIAPVPLLAGAPITLALRAMRRRPPGTGDERSAQDPGRSPREALTALLHGRVVRLLAFPPVAAVVFVLSLYGFYYSALFEESLRNHLVHSVLMVPFVAAGMLVLWPLTGAQAGPYRLGRGGRIALASVLAGCHLLFGLAFMRTGTVLAGGWYADLARSWGASSLQDQHTGGLVAWALTLPVSLLLVVAAARPRGGGSRVRR